MLEGGKVVYFPDCIKEFFLFAMIVYRLKLKVVAFM